VDENTTVEATTMVTTPTKWVYLAGGGRGVIKGGRGVV